MCIKSSSIALILVFITIVCFVFSCCHSGAGYRSEIPGVDDGGTTYNQKPYKTLKTVWPAALPVDAIQPWESLESNGYVTADTAGSRTTSAINADTEFTPGVERYIESGDVSDSSEASRFASGIVGDKSVSYALYRVPMGAGQPGAISLDVNLRADSNGNKSKYYVGISDYEHGTWKWLGSFIEPDVRLIVPTGDYTSELGNTFIAVVAYDGSNFDVIGVGVNARDDADTTAPDALTDAPSVTSVLGGVQVEWNSVIASDLAGYRVYTANLSFETAGDTGVRSLTYIEGGTRIVIPSSDETFIRVASIDVSGNESDLSEIASATPTTGDAINVILETDINSGIRGAYATLTATGAESYDFDLDGDGIFDITGNMSGTTQTTFDSTGVIRPAVRGTTGPGGVAFSAVSLIISSNSRPVASAETDVSFGKAPLTVNFSGTGDDEDGTIDSYAWDFDGDGTYDSSNQNDSHVYDTEGLYNVKFRVEDNDGAWDVDTVSVFIYPPDDPSNESPSADIQGDVTSGNAPLTVNFNATASTDPDGTIALLEWDFESDGIYDGYGTDATISHIYTDPGSYTAKLRVTDNDGARDVAGIAIHVNALPEALLTATPPDCERGETVRYEASGSTDSDGSVTNYEWDLDNDGTYSEAGDEADAKGDSFVEVTYSNSGQYTVSVRVTDNASPTGTDETTADVCVHGWSIASPNPDTTADNGYYTSLCMVDGCPAISYYDFSNNDLKYVRASDINGTTWGTPITIDSEYAVGTHTSLCIVNGYPAIAYCGVTNKYLKYVRAADKDGNSWITPMTLDSSNNVFEYVSMTVVNGNPAISYYNSDLGDLRYIRASNANGTAWGSFTTPDSAGFVGGFTSLAVVDGVPAISYYDLLNSDLKYVYASDVNGSSWETPVTVDSTDAVGYWSSMKVVDGFPAISYYDDSTNVLNYVRAKDSAGSTWGNPIILDVAVDIGVCSSMCVVGGYVYVSYEDGSTNDLKCIRSADSDGDYWETPVTIDSDGYVGIYTSITDVNGSPAIAYCDYTNYRMKYARLY